MAKLNTRSNIRLNDLIAQALDIQGRCKDILLPGAFTGRRGSKKETGALNPGLTSATVTHDSGFDEFGVLHFLAPVGAGEDGKTLLSMPVSAKLTQWSFFQLCSVRLGVPHSFMAKCLESDLSDIQRLFPTTVNAFMSHYDTATRIRLYQPEAGAAFQVRGVVSGSYAVFDSDEVLATVKDVMSDDFNVVGYGIDEEGLHVRLTSPEPLSIAGEDLYPGLLITSGDVGNGSLQVQFFLFKQVCTNGLVMSRMTGKVLHKRHLGIYSSDDFKASLVDALESFPVFCANAAELVERARTAGFEGDDLKTEIEKFKAGSGVKLTETEERQIVDLTTGRYAGPNGVVTLWGFINSLTEFAQSQRFDLDARVGIETYAADLMMAA